jgi:hypothetical protein
MLQRTDLAGSFILPGTAITVNGMGYGAIQLAGPEVWGFPARCECRNRQRRLQMGAEEPPRR